MHQKLDEQAALAAAAATRSAIGGHGSQTVAADGGGSGDYISSLYHLSPKIQPHLKCVATLPCEMPVSYN